MATCAPASCAASRPHAARMGLCARIRGRRGSAGAVEVGARSMPAADTPPPHPPSSSPSLPSARSTFYRDEYVVVLDRLCREFFVREDDLRGVFGLSDRQMRRVLNDLVEERLVCVEEVTERLRGKRDARLDMENQLADLIAAAKEPPGSKKKKSKKKKGDIDFDDDSDDDDDDDDDTTEDDEPLVNGGYGGGGRGGAGGSFGMRGGRGGGGRGGQAKKRKRKVKTSCYFLNPRYFADAVKYRLHLMRKHLETLQRVREGSENVYRCGNARCVFECTLLEAEQRRQSVISAKRAAQAARSQQVSAASYYTGGMRVGGSGMGTVTGSVIAVDAGSSAASSSSSSSSSAGKAGAGGVDASDYEYTCPLCGSRLTARAVENIAAAASRLLGKFNDQLRATGIPQVLKQLDTIPLGPNRPSDTIKAGLVTLYGEGDREAVGVAATDKNAAAAAAVAVAAGASGEGKAGGGGGTGGGGGGAGAGAGGAGGAGGGAGGRGSGSAPVSMGLGRVYLKQRQQIDVLIEEEGGGGEGGGGAGSSSSSSSSSSAAAPKRVQAAQIAASVLPSFLTASVLTGEASRTFGFMHRGGGGGGGAGGAGGGPGDSDAAAQAAAAASAALVASTHSTGVDISIDLEPAGAPGYPTGAVAGAGSGPGIGSGDGDADGGEPENAAQSAAAVLAEGVDVYDTGVGGGAAGMSDADLWAALWAGLAEGGGGGGGGGAAAEGEGGGAGEGQGEGGEAAAAAPAAAEEEEDWEDV
jgi:transcription initiation factor IIE alpha subunit